MKNKDIRFLRITHLSGPNIWTYRPVLEAWVDIGDLEDCPSNTIPGLYERLTAWLPGLIEHRCGVGERGGFLQRLREGTWPAHILEHVTLELQNLAGMKVGFGKARETSVRGVYKVAVRTRNEQVGRACLQDARDLLMAAIEDRPFDMTATTERLRNLADTLCLGPSTACIVDAATESHIPYIRLTDGNLVQLGYGARQRRIWTAETDQTAAIAESIASDKDLTKSLLGSCGVPVPEGRLVGSPQDAWEAAEDIGLPVAVKPVDANHGRGVSLDLMTQAHVEAAYAVARAESRKVIVERHIPGHEHRLLVVGGRLVAAARGEMIWVKGDGHSTITELIDTQLNTDPRRGIAEDFPLSIILIDEEPAIRLELARQGLSPESIPAAGQEVLVQRNGNVAIDVTDTVHPEVTAMATLAARIVGLDVAGVDLVVEDIARPLDQQRGAIVEVNAGPGLLMHLKPAQGKPRPVGRAIVDHLIPQSENGRIPVVGISGANGTLIARLVASLLHLSGHYVGLACSDGLYMNQRQVERGDCSTWLAGQRLLMNRAVEAAVFEHPATAILREGLPYDRCQVGVVTEVSGADTLGEFYISEPDQLYNVLRTQMDVVLSDGVGVLNADDARVVKMASLCDGAVIYFGLDPHQPTITGHRSKGGRAVFARNGQIILASGPNEIDFASLAALPLTRPGQPNQHTVSLLAAIGAALALGIAPELIHAGIETFEMEQPVKPLF
ncbi:MAG: cyanophycin synthetase [Sulfuriferula sp.]